MFALRTVAFVVTWAAGVQEGGYVVIGALFGLSPDIARALSLLKRTREIVAGVPGLIAWHISEGRRFPKLAEFYYREVLSRIVAAVRALLTRAAARGEVPEALAEFPQIIAAPGLVAIIWSGLFERFEPLDVRKMMRTHVELLFATRRAP